MSTKSRKVVRRIYCTIAVLLTVFLTVVGHRFYQLNAAIMAIKGYGGTVFFYSPDWLPKRFNHVAIPYLHGRSSVNLSRTAIQDDDMPRIVDHLNRLGEVLHLSLDDTSISDEGLKELQRFEFIPHPRHISGEVVGPARYGSSILWVATVLGLSGTQITDEGLKHISHLSTLQVLDLSGTRISDRGMREIVPLRGMLGLILDGTDVGDEGIAHLAGLKDLKDLSVSNTQVTDAGIERLAEKLPALDVSDD